MKKIQAQTSLGVDAAITPRNSRHPTFARRGLWALAGAAACLASLAAIPAAMAQDPSATRELPASFTRGESFGVTIQANPGDTPDSWVVTEKIPEGLTVEGDISHGGNFVASQSEIRWGSFQDNSPRTLTFTLASDGMDSETEIVEFGDGSFLFADPPSSSFDIGGDTTVLVEQEEDPGDPEDPEDPEDPTGPTISGHPGPAIVTEGETATFQVAAEGTGDLQYQWQHNGADISGGTDSTLVIENVTLEDAGTYRVRVTDDVDSTFSNDTTLTVEEAEEPEPEIPDPFVVEQSNQPHLHEIHNLAGTYESTFALLDGEITVNFVLAHNQHGRLTGDGDLTYSSPSLEEDLTSDELTVHGNVRRIGHPSQPIYRVNLTLRAVGQATVGEDEGPFSIVLNQLLEVDAENDRLVGQIRGNALIIDDFKEDEAQAHEIALPEGHEGTWTLSVIPPVERGGQGTAVLNIQGDELTYAVTHHHLRVQNVDVFHLRGTGEESRGSNIRLDLSADGTVLRMFGRANGQTLRTRIAAE